MHLKPWCKVMIRREDLRDGRLPVVLELAVRLHYLHPGKASR